MTEIGNKEIVIGKYVLSEKSKEYLISKGFLKQCRLNVLISGNFELVDIPEFVFDTYGDEKNISILNISGKWIVSCDTSYGCQIELNKLCIVPLIKNGDGIISIPITIGDSDECNGIVFEQIK